MIRSEQLLREAREQDHTCEFCYYEFFDDRAYPCSRCVCNQPTECMWRPKIKDEPQKIGYCNECKWYGDKQVCGRCRSRKLYAPKDEPQIDCRTCKHNESGWYEKGSLSCERCCGDDFEFYEPKDEPQERSE